MNTQTKVTKWSPQQAAFLDWAQNGSGSCVLEAVAGAGKTTTLIEAARTMRGQTAILAFNKKIAEEIKEKLVAKGVDWKKAQAGTVHSFGLKTLRRAVEQGGQRVVVDGDKVRGILAHWLPTHLLALEGGILKMVSMAKQRALGVIGAIEDKHEWFEIIEHFDVFGDIEDDTALVDLDPAVELAQKVLKLSNENIHLIDFDDMVYLPLLHKMPFWRFDNVMVDEAQDTNPARRALVRALVRKGGRVIAVGDRHQAIYGFTGADNDSLDRIAQDFNAVRLPLTVSYRCPIRVVQFAHSWVSHIEAHETAPQGSVQSEYIGEFMRRKDLDGNSAVLCRNTRPLVSTAMGLLRSGVGCRIEGRDIGAGLVKYLKRWKVSGLDALVVKLEDYLEKQTQRLNAKNRSTQAAVLEDTIGALLTIIEQCQSVGKVSIPEVQAYIEGLFADDVRGVLVLSTIHKAKGREWERVFWLDRENTCPSRWARQQWQMDQELNLCYVAATRAKMTLVELYV